MSFWWPLGSTALVLLVAWYGGARWTTLLWAMPVTLVAIALIVSWLVFRVFELDPAVAGPLCLVAAGLIIAGAWYYNRQPSEPAE